MNRNTNLPKERNLDFGFMVVEEDEGCCRRGTILWKCLLLLLLILLLLKFVKIETLFEYVRDENERLI